MRLTTIISTLQTERGEIDEAVLFFEGSLNTETAERTARAVTEIGRSRNHLGFQAGQQPQPAAATIDRRVGVVERALRYEFPDAGSIAPGFHHFYWGRSSLGIGRPRPTISRLRVKEPNAL